MGGNINSKGVQQQSHTKEDILPPFWAQPLYKKYADDAMKLYNSGKGGRVYQGQRVNDLSDQTKNSIDHLQDSAKHYQNSYLQNLLNNQTSSAKNLQDMASGKMVGHNQQFDEILQNALNKTASTINAQMSGAGRYGSAANNQILANNLGNVASKAKSEQYNQDVANMLRANNLIDQSHINQVNSANNFFQGEANDWINSLKGGRILDENSQKKLDAARQKWTEQDQEGWRRLGFLGDAMRNSSGKYGVRDQETDSKKSNPLGTLGGIFGKIIGK